MTKITLFIIHLFFAFHAKALTLSESNLIAPNVSDINDIEPPSNWTFDKIYGDTLFINGEIQEIQWSQIEFGDYKGIRHLVLNSYGGSVEGALELARVIRKNKISTLIPAGGVCMSACTLVFQAGINRQAHATSLFLFHTPRTSQIGLSELDSKCELNCKKSCKELEDKLTKKIKEQSFKFIQLHLEMGLSDAILSLIEALPEQPKDIWRENGNWLKKGDLIFSGKEESELKKYRYSTFHKLQTLQDLNMITDIFTTNFGWEIDYTFIPNLDSGMP